LLYNLLGNYRNLRLRSRLNHNLYFWQSGRIFQREAWMSKISIISIHNIEELVYHFYIRHMCNHIINVISMIIQKFGRIWTQKCWKVLIITQHLFISIWVHLYNCILVASIIKLKALLFTILNTARDGILYEFKWLPLNINREPWLWDMDRLRLIVKQTISTGSCYVEITAKWFYIIESRHLDGIISTNHAGMQWFYTDCIFPRGFWLNACDPNGGVCELLTSLKNFIN
jgi:hypothetical protein